MILPVPSGILVLDKPSGVSSARAIKIVKSRLGVKKLGHTGTLDPMATGVLVCCINHATKLAGFYLEGRKTYEAVMVLGTETDTQDATGTIIAQRTVDSSKLSLERIQANINGFEGSIEQTPPVYSALKHKGLPLYKYASRGTPIQKPSKRIRIDRITLLDVNLPKIRFSVICSAGTYIRTLCADIGNSLGCGGHLEKLRRTRSSEFSLKQAVHLEELPDLVDSTKILAKIIPLADLLQTIPAVSVSGATAGKIRNGIILRTGRFDFLSETPPAGFLRILSEEKDLVAIIRRRDSGDRFDYRCIIPAEPL